MTSPDWAEEKARELTQFIEGYAWDDDYKFAQKTVPMLASALRAARDQGFEAAREMAVEWARTEVAVWKHVPLTPQDVASLAVAERMVRVLRALKSEEGR